MPGCKLCGYGASEDVWFKDDRCIDCTKKLLTAARAHEVQLKTESQKVCVGEGPGAKTIAIIDIKYNSLVIGEPVINAAIQHASITIAKSVAQELADNDGKGN